MSTDRYPMRRPWQLACVVCGEVSAETYDGLHFCETHWQELRNMMVPVEWKADVRFLVEKMKLKGK